MEDNTIKNSTNHNSADKQLDNLLKDILDNGVEVVDPRTGEHTLALFDNKVVVSEGEFPWFTKNASSPRLAFEELWFFLRGETQTKKLEEKGVYFWKGNTSEEAIKRVGLDHMLIEGELGAAYSRQWRNCGGYWSGVGHGIDQLEDLLLGLKDNKYGRRHLVTLWNPTENHIGVITPCHHTSQYVVLPSEDGDVLHVKLINRSLDTPYGMRFALMQYRMFQMALCKMFGFKLGRLSLDLSQYHIYYNQIEYVKEYLERDSVSEDKCSIKIKDSVELKDMDDLLNMEWEDWDMDYEFNKAPFITERPRMVV
mgnify:FL=1